ncbi:MAG: ABC transporter ATP-binding protein [Eggerthellaceae bacterium]|nr:ABC transporter ATP-binding protein [Eggerthellaceae bacterium]
MSHEADMSRSHSADHAHERAHHHHTHAHNSIHERGHHLLQVSDLSVAFRMYDADAPFFSAKRVASKAIDGLSISVHAGEVVAVVGASGSGKTLLADSIMGLYEPNAYVEGEIWFDGASMDAASLARVRGAAGGIALVPQGVSHLDPLMRVGKQVGDPEQCAELFARYGLAEEVMHLDPHQRSGGMARRVLLCTALASEPKLIIADEPTPGLDIELAVAALSDFRAFADEGGGVLLITHDIELALRVADRVAVFKDGTVVEETAVANFASPDKLRHPFTRALWHALPEHDFSGGEMC